MCFGAGCINFSNSVQHDCLCFCLELKGKKSISMTFPVAQPRKQNKHTSNLSRKIQNKKEDKGLNSKLALPISNFNEGRSQATFIFLNIQKIIAESHLMCVLGKCFYPRTVLLVLTESKNRAYLSPSLKPQVRHCKSGLLIITKILGQLPLNISLHSDV